MLICGRECLCEFVFLIPLQNRSSALRWVNRRAVKLLRVKLSRVFERALSSGVESLSSDERELYLIQDFIIELEMGGLSGYFYNRLPLNNQISAAIAAMRKYGLNELAGFLDEANQLLASGIESDPAQTWFEVLELRDQDNRLAAIEQSINALDNYGVGSSLIE